MLGVAGVCGPNPERNWVFQDLAPPLLWEKDYARVKHLKALADLFYLI
jgi:hypothetical protein